MHQVSKILFCHETLHVSGMFCAHHQELPAVHVAVGMFRAGNSWWWAQKMPEHVEFCDKIKFWILDASCWLFIRKKKVYCSSCEVRLPVILGRFWWNMNFLDRFFKNNEMSNFMTIRPVIAKLFRADGRTGRQTWRNLQSLFAILWTHLKVGSLLIAANLGKPFTREILP
jgi:hypothetical protein